MAYPRNDEWVITYDHLESAKVNFPMKGHTVPFRLFDDDDILYYSGFMTEKLYDSHLIMDPLDWATHDSGCTRLDVNGPRELVGWVTV